MAASVPYLIAIYVGVAIVLFTRLSRPVAVLAVALIGTLALPELQTSPAPPVTVHSVRVTPLDFTKVNVINYGLLAGWLLVDGGRLRGLHLTRFDGPAVLATLFPAVSSVINGNSVEMTFDELNSGIMAWGVPYFIGRIYLREATGCWRVTAALALGGLVYLPLCLFESRMSPQLHYWLYGFHQHDFAQTYRYGGYRPMVFMQHGLAVALFMAAASLCLYWLWRCAVWPFPQLPRFLRRWPGAWSLALAATAVLCRSLGAAALGLAGFVTLVASPLLRSRLLLLGLALLPPVYVTARISGLLSADTIFGAIGRQVDKERAESLGFRLKCEDKLIAGLGEQWIYGVGGQVKDRPKDDFDRPIVTDGLWIITYYDSGAIGVAAVFAMLLLPVARFLSLHPAEAWRTPAVAPAAVAATVVALFAIDSLSNAMPNVMYMLLVAALTGWNETVAAYCEVPANVAR